MNKKPKINDLGFTIVELVVTIVVGGIFAISVSNLVSENSHLSQRSRDIVTVNSFVEGKVEELRSIGYSGLSNGTTTVTNQLPSELDSPKSATVVITTPTNGLKKADISVTYNDQGVNTNYSYTTYIGELGVGQY